MNKLIIKTRIQIIFDTLISLSFPVCVIGIMLFALLKLQEYNNTQSNENAVQYLSAVIGAFVGGFITLYASILVSKADKKSKQISRKKSKLYMPLYDEIVQFIFVLSENPYPYEINFDGRYRGYWKVPVFETWNKIKEDSRYLLVPKILQKWLDEITESMNNYLKSYKKAVLIYDCELKKSAKDIIGCQPLFVNWGESTFSNFLGNLMENESLFTHKEIHFEDGTNRMVSKEEETSLEKILRQRINGLEEIRILKENQNILTKKIKITKEYLAWIIKIIEKKYENGISYL